MNGDIDFKAMFGSIADFAFGELLPAEAAELTFSAESSSFLRWNGARIRQTGAVDQAHLFVQLYAGGKTFAFRHSLSGDAEADRETFADRLSAARATLPLLPPDPFQVLPSSSERSDAGFRGALLSDDELPEALLDAAAGLDYVGTHSQGLVCRGAANSAGARHWFSTETFLVDCSAYLPNEKAVKSSYAGRAWDAAEYAKILEGMRRSLAHLDAPDKVLAPGNYRAYVAPEALAELVTFFSWDGLGERGLRQGESAYTALRDGRERFSEKFGLSQDFSLGVEQAFNSASETAPELLRVVDRGRLANTLVCARTAKQYGVPSNAAPDDESLRSAAIDPGTLDEAEVLGALGTGLYIPNFHYLNWSDTETARVTGMTRFACLWVEDGRVVSPIKDLRFDESLYRLFGDKLVDLTKERRLVVDPTTYERRALGGSLLPGILVDGLTFTL